MKIDLKVLAKLAETYVVSPAPAPNKLAATIAACTKAPAQYEPILTGNGYTWDDQLNAYIAPEQEIYYFAPKNIFLWIWNRMLIRPLQGAESLQKWVQGNNDYPEGKAKSFMGLYKEMTGQSDASAGGAGVAVADPESDENIPNDVAIEPSAEEPIDIKFDGSGDRGKEYVPQPQNPADMFIKQIQRKAKVDPDAKLSKQAPIRLPTDDIIDLFQKAQQMSEPDKEKLMAFIKTIKPLEENTAKASTINELVRIIVKGVLNEAWQQTDPGSYGYPEHGSPEHKKKLVFADPDASRYVQDLANKLWPDPTDPSPDARGHWRVKRVKQHPSGEISYIVSQEIQAIQTRHFINKGNEWYYFNPQAKGTDRKWKKVTDSEVRVPRVPGEEGDAGYANEETGTSAVSPVSKPFAVSKKNVKEGQYISSTNDAIQKIKAAGKYDEFIRIYGRTPEDYFAEYEHKTPDVWTWVMNDLNIISEMTTTGDVAGYNIPAAFSKRGGSEKGVQGSEKLGYTLTGAGKKEMQRSADKLLENKNNNQLFRKADETGRQSVLKKIADLEKSLGTESDPQKQSDLRNRIFNLKGHSFLNREK